MHVYPVLYVDASDTAPHLKQLRGLGKVIAVVVQGAHTADVTLTLDGQAVLTKTGIGSAAGTYYYPERNATTTDGATAIANSFVPIVARAGSSFSCTLANGTANEAFSVTVIVDHN